MTWGKYGGCAVAGALCLSTRLDQGDLGRVEVRDLQNYKCEGLDVLGFWWASHATSDVAWVRRHGLVRWQSDSEVAVRFCG